MEIRREVEVGAGRVVAARGDLTTAAIDVVVNAANDRLQHGGGLAGALVTAGGAVIQDESDTWVREHGALRGGTAAVTTAGALPCDHLVHVAGPVYREGADNAGLLAAAVRAALDAAAELGARRVGMPALSAGIFGYPVADAAAVIAATVRAWLTDVPGRDVEVWLVAVDEEVTEAFVAALDAPS